MNDTVEFKRMNFFKGFFTTAQDWTDGQKYFLEKRKLHNRTMHTPGIVRDPNGLLELQVLPKGGLTLEIQPGAAIDAEGREIYVPESQQISIDPTAEGWLYIAIQYSEQVDDYVEYEDQPYKGYSRILEKFEITVRTSIPQNKPWVELARIEKTPGMTEITANNIDRSQVNWAGAVGVELPQLDDKAAFLLVMENKRQSYASLAKYIPVPSSVDVRNAAFTIWLMVLSNNLNQQYAFDVLAALVEVEGDVIGEILSAYPDVKYLYGFSEYQDAVTALNEMVMASDPIDQILTQDGKVNFQIDDFISHNDFKPIAEPSIPPPPPTNDEQVVVVLDGSASSSALGAKYYHWERISYTEPGD